MLVDDEGLLKCLPMNPAAMMISGYPMLVGAALIVGLMPTEDGDVFTDCPQRFIRFAESVQQEGGKLECVNGQKKTKTVTAHQSESVRRLWLIGS